MELPLLMSWHLVDLLPWATCKTIWTLSISLNWRLQINSKCSFIRTPTSLRCTSCYAMDDKSQSISSKRQRLPEPFMSRIYCFHISWYQRHGTIEGNEVIETFIPCLAMTFQATDSRGSNLIYLSCTCENDFVVRLKRTLDFK